MSEEFISEGLTDDRYLKADKLVQRFESEVLELIREESDRVIEANPDLFPEEVDFNERTLGASYSNTLATLRNEFDLKPRVDVDASLRLNIAIEWVEPDAQDIETGSETSLSYVLYKIQRDAEGRFRDVIERTSESGDWSDIRFGEDQWPHHSKQAPGIVYIPIETGAEVSSGLKLLGDHFSAEYAPEFRE